jgi:hypothetical protein
LAKVPIIHNGERTVSSINDIGKSEYSQVSFKLDLYLMPYIKISSNCTTEFNTQPGRVETNTQRTQRTRSMALV